MGYPAPSPKYIGPANRHGSQTNKPIKRIVIHCTISPCCKGAEGIASYFKRTSNPASAHYVVDAKTVIQSLYDSWVGYHAPPNEHSLGIEMCCTLANEGKGHWGRRGHQKMLKRTARLTAELCLAYDIPVRHLTVAQLRAGEKGICGHVDVRDAFHETTHWDPGPHFPWDQFIELVRSEVAAITKEAVKPATPKRRDTKVRKARRALRKAVRLLSQSGPKRKHVKRVGEEIQKQAERLPKQ